MAKRIEVGKIYKNKGTNKILFVVELDENNARYYFLDDPETVIERYIPDARYWWDDV